MARKLGEVNKLGYIRTLRKTTKGQLKNFFLWRLNESESKEVFATLKMVLTRQFETF